jgi:hypothetical protein
MDRPTCGKTSVSSFLEPALSVNWLQVLYTAERSQVDQRIRHQLHPIVSLLDAFKAQEQSFKFVLPRKGPLDAQA